MVSLIFIIDMERRSLYWEVPLITIKRGFDEFLFCRISWWRHQMEIFSALLDLCVGNSPVTGEFRTQRPVTRSFDVFFDLHQNKRLNKQPLGWRFETPSRPLWRHSNMPLFIIAVDGREYVTVFIYIYIYWPVNISACYNATGPIIKRTSLTWSSNHMPSKVWDEIIHPFLNFNGANIEIWELINNSPHTL